MALRIGESLSTKALSLRGWRAGKVGLPTDLRDAATCASRAPPTCCSNNRNDAVIRDRAACRLFTMPPVIRAIEALIGGPIHCPQTARLLQ